MFNKRTPPLNVVGGFSFPDAPKLDLSPIPVTTVAGPDLPIPDFLKRSFRSFATSPGSGGAAADARQRLQ